MSPENKHRGPITENWGTIASKLPQDFTPREAKLLKAYFRAQVRIASGGTKKASRIFASLDKQLDYSAFETKRVGYLAAVDVAVKGDTRWGVKPAFVLDNNNPQSGV